MCHARINGETLRKLLKPEKFTIDTERVEKHIQDANAKAEYKRKVDDTIVELAEREQIPVQMTSTSSRRRQQRLRFFRRKGR